jgi:hypothetical protein
MKLSKAQELAEQAIYDYTSASKWQEVKYMKWKTAEIQDVIAEALIKNLDSKITDMETVYEFYYNDCIHESMAACISLHRTRKGAEMAMEFHKEQKRKEFEELYKDEEDIDWTFDSMCAWGVNERTVVE